MATSDLRVRVVCDAPMTTRFQLGKHPEVAGSRTALPDTPRLDPCVISAKSRVCILSLPPSHTRPFTQRRLEDCMRDSVTFESTSSRGQALRRGGVGLMLLGVLGIATISTVSCVRTGHVGVETLFGRVTGRTMPEGIHMVNPLSKVHQLDVKTQELKERASVP